MKLVPVGAAAAEVDDADYALVAQYSWHKYVQRCGPGGCFTTSYARRRWKEGGKRRTQAMHNLIMGQLGVDHRDHNGLNNKRSNLRVATNGQNQANRRTSAQYRGIFKDRSGKWVARIRQPVGKREYLGYFSDPEEAARAYDRAAVRIHGEFALLNFPQAVA